MRQGSREVELHASPELYPLAIDDERGLVRLLRLREADYKAASFLDERLEGGAPSLLLPLPRLEASARRMEERYHFIFHIGHVGSTLVSRLLDEHPRLFSVREPELLRRLARRYTACALAGHVQDQRLGHQTEMLLRLWSRVWRPEQTAVIKATSFVSGMAFALMKRAPAATRAIYMSVTPLTYLRAVISRPQSLTELHMMAPLRRQRLAQRLNAPALLADSASIGELIAMTWLCEALALWDAARTNPAAGLWLDFDVFLSHPESALDKVLAHLGLPGGDAAAVLSTPVMGRYSKDTSHAYDMAERRQLLREAQLAHGREIELGMAWLADLAKTSPIVRQAVEAIATLGVAL